MVDNIQTDDVFKAVNQMIEVSDGTLKNKKELQKNKQTTQIISEKLIKLKLIRGLSYSGIITASINEPFINVTEENAEKLIKTGYFIKLN